MYEIKFSENAEKQFKKLERGLQERITAALKRIRVRPFDYVERLSGMPFYKMRAGDFRLIMDIQQNIMLILVIEIGHRKNICKGFIGG